jgi:predicted GIY-YIG superfamily endonuclease
MCGDLKPSLIDLEAGSTATGRKRTENTQRERLSERGKTYYVYWIKCVEHSDIFSEGYVGISCNPKERMRAHKKNKKDSPLRNAILKYGWDNLTKVIINSELSLEEALTLERKFRPAERIGWNLQTGGFIGVEPEWYKIPSNREQHSNATSVNTKLGIQKKDTVEARSERAKQNWKKNKDSYKYVSVGENNPKALLTEDNVKYIKYTLIPLGKTNSEIASLYSVKHYVISFIRTGKTWKHV